MERFKYVVPKNPISWEFSHVLFHQHGNTLELRVGDYSLNASFAIYAQARSGEVRVLVPYRKLRDFVKGIPAAATIVCTQIKEENGPTYFLVESTSGDSSFLCLDAERYPDFPGVKDGHPITLGVNDFRDMVARTAFAADETDYFNLHGVYFHFLPDRTAFVATDRLVMSIYECRHLVFPDVKNVIVPVKALQAFVHGIKKVSSTEKVDILISEGRIQLSCGGFILNSTLIDREYPPYQSVIPSNTPYVAIFERKKLYEAIKQLLPSRGRDFVGIDLIFEGDNVMICIQDRGIKSTYIGSMISKPDGDNLHIGFNARMLLSIVENINGERIVMKIASNTRPVIIEPETQAPPIDMLCLIMPLAQNA
jgi:DNA polymerase-3 subunit beta